MYINYDLFIYLGWAISGVALVFLFCFSFYYLIFCSVSGKPVPPVPHSDELTKFAILIAARDESKVIRNIFSSLKEQTYNKDYYDVWIIVEDINDPSVKIAEEFGYHYFVRDNLVEGRKTKGFALQECINHFKRNNIRYDAYLIFDADNVMDKNYIEVMNDLRQTGVKVGLGYRNFTNANTNWLTIGSAIMFSYMNQITSRGRTVLFHKATLMGTGYYIDSQLIDDVGGWIFTGMTEDIQLTTYCIFNDVYMRYYPLVSFYDEQSPVYKTVHMQHLRWLAGYFEKRQYLKKAGLHYNYHPHGMESLRRFEFNYGLVPFILFNVVSALMFIIAVVIGAICIIYNPNPFYLGMIWGLAGYELFMLYAVFFIPALLVIIRDNKNIKLSKKNCVVGVATYFLFFYEFVLAFLDGFFHPKKRTTWNVIKHTGDITNEDAKKVK